MAKDNNKWQKLKSVRRKKKILITFEALFAAFIILVGVIWFVPPVKSAFTTLNPVLLRHDYIFVVIAVHQICLAETAEIIDAGCFSY